MSHVDLATLGTIDSGNQFGSAGGASEIHIGRRSAHVGSPTVGDSTLPFASFTPQTLGVVDMELTGLISPRMRHIIKRFVKKVGLRNIKVEHLCDGGPATVRLVVTGDVGGGLSTEQTSKLEYLEAAIRKSLSRPVNGFVPHPST